MMTKIKQDKKRLTFLCFVFIIYYYCYYRLNKFGLLTPLFDYLFI